MPSYNNCVKKPVTCHVSADCKPMIMSNSSQAQVPPTSSTTLPRGERQISNAELWHACAGPLVSLPAVGSHVIYFPQGHSEQVAASTQREVVGHIPSYRDLPPELVCRLDALILQADEDTDEVYCQMTLQPVTLQVNDCVTVPDVGLQNKHPNIFFCKTLTASDTSTHGGFSIPRRAAEEVFPPLDYSLQPPTQEIVARDLHDREWKFRHVFRGQPKRHLLTTGWSVFVSSKRLVAGDAVLFIRNKKGQLLLGIRRANRPQTVMPSSVLSSDTMHIGVLAAAAHAASTRSQFTVFYNPRTSPSEFVIPLSKYEKAMYHVRASMGMRFGMLFESEESRVRRYMGTITAISDLDPVRWPNSSWRSIKVIWDESSLGTWRRRICLWEIEPLPTFLSCPPSSSWRWNCPWPQLLDFSLSSGMQLESSTNLAMVQNENAGLNCMAVQAMGLDTLAGNFPRQLDTASGSDLQNTLGAASWPAIFGLKQLHFQQQPMWAGQMLYNVQAQPQQRSPNPTFQQHQPEEPHLKIQPHPLASPAIQQRKIVKTHFPSCEEVLSPHLATQQKQTLAIQQLKQEGSTLQQQTQGESPFQQPNALQQQLQMPIKQQAKQSSTLEEGLQHGPIPQQLAHQQPVKESGAVHYHIKQASTLQQQTKQKAFTPPPKHSSSPLQHQHASTLTEKITHEPPFQQQLKQSTSFQHASTLREESLSQPPMKLLKQSNGLSYPQYPEVFLEPHSNVLQRYTGAFPESHSTVLQQQQTHAEKPSERHFSLLPAPSCGSESCVINIQPQAPPSSITSTPQLMSSKPIGTLNSMAGPCDRTRLVNPLAALDDSLSTPSVHANIEMDNAHATMMLGPELYHLSFVGEESLFSPSSQPASAAQSEVTSASGPVKTPFASLEMHSGLQASVPASAALSSTLLNTRDSWQEHDDLHSECHQQTSFGVTTTYNMYPDEFQSQCLNHLIEGESSSIPLTSQSFYGSVDNKNSLAPSSQATAPIRTYTKVYKSGSVGRSLDVARFNGYSALRHELARMFGLEGQLVTSQSGWQLIFVDKENDWLLLGDDPWEVFIHNVRSIRILSPVEVLQMQDGIVGLPSTLPVYPQQTSGNSQDVIIQQDPHDLSCVITPTCMLP